MKQTYRTRDAIVSGVRTSKGGVLVCGESELVDLPGFMFDMLLQPFTYREAEYVAELRTGDSGELSTGSASGPEDGTETGEGGASSKTNPGPAQLYLPFVEES